MSYPELPHSQQGGWVRFIAGFGHAFSGLWYALRTQRNMRVHVIIAIIVIMASILLHLSTVEFALIFIAITGVFIEEILNKVNELFI
jgi:diacylglycerol kinase